MGLLEVKDSEVEKENSENTRTIYRLDYQVVMLAERRGLCLLCMTALAGGSRKPNKLKRHL